MKKSKIAIALVTLALAACAALAIVGCSSPQGVTLRVALGNDMNTTYEWAMSDTGGALVEKSRSDSEIDSDTKGYTTIIELVGAEGHAGDVVVTFTNTSQSDDPTDTNGVVTVSITLNDNGTIASLNGTDFETDFPCSVILYDKNGKEISAAGTM